MKLRQQGKVVVSFLRKNYLLSLFVLIVAFVSLLVLYRSLSSDSNYIYAKVKVSQGLWWAGTMKPSVWYADAIQKGDKELSGNTTIAEILSVRRYPQVVGGAYAGDQRDVFLTLKLEATYNPKTRKYYYGRSPLVVSSPIDFEFNTVGVSGTVMAVSENPFSAAYIEKTVHLTKYFSVNWEYDQIQVGDTYFDGEDTVFTVTEKRMTDSIIGTRVPGTFGTGKDITIKALLKVQTIQDQLIYAEEQVIKPGNLFFGETQNFQFRDYVIQRIE